MRRGTSPTHTFTLPFDTNIVAKVRIIYAQRDVIKIVKKETDCEMSGNTISVKLTQADTLRLSCSLKTDIQLKVLTVSNDSFVSDIITRNTDKCLSDEVL